MIIQDSSSDDNDDGSEPECEEGESSQKEVSRRDEGTQASSAPLHCDTSVGLPVKAAPKKLGRPPSAATIQKRLELAAAMKAAGKDPSSKSPSYFPVPYGLGKSQYGMPPGVPPGLVKRRPGRPPKCPGVGAAKYVGRPRGRPRGSSRGRPVGSKKPRGFLLSASFPSRNKPDHSSPTRGPPCLSPLNLSLSPSRKVNAHPPTLEKSRHDFERSPNSGHVNGLKSDWACGGTSENPDSPRDDLSTDSFPPPPMLVPENKEVEVKNYWCPPADVKPVIDNVFITDVTTDAVTITFRESTAEDGFFRKRDDCTSEGD